MLPLVIENYREIKKQVESVAIQAGRDPKEITLIAVSKTKPLSDIEELITIGVEDFGENKVQELCDKYENVSKPVRFHQIGHLQTNKVKYVVDKAYMIHSVDSLKLAKEIQKEAVKKNVISQILIEVNVANEESKFGLKVEEVIPFLEQIKEFDHIHVNGLILMMICLTKMTAKKKIIMKKNRKSLIQKPEIHIEKRKILMIMSRERQNRDQPKHRIQVS